MSTTYLGRGLLGYQRNYLDGPHQSLVYLGEPGTCNPIDLPTVDVAGRTLLAAKTGSTDPVELGTIRSIAVPDKWEGDTTTSRPTGRVAIYLDDPDWLAIEGLLSDVEVILEAVPHA